MTEEESAENPVERWDAPAYRYLSGLVDEELRNKRLAALSEAFAAERERIGHHLDDPAFDDATRAEMRAAFEIGDLVTVEIL
ncbi:MAG: hypothetical protein ACXWUG_02035, partial [Polyangiales bacterium]